MILDATTDSLEIVLDKVVTTQLNYTTYYTAYTSTTVTPTASYGATNNTSSVNLVPPPSANQQHQLKYCAINNVGSQDVGTKIRFNANGSFRNLLYVYLGVSESIQYSEEMGWRVYTVNGEEKVTGHNKLPSTLKMPEWFGAGDVITTLALANTDCFCIYLGKAYRPFSSVSIQYRITTAITATISWAELAIYSGNPTLSTGTTMTRLGSTDTSGIWNSLGIKTTTVTTTGMAVGDDLWAVFSNSTTGTVASVRAGLADNLGAGFFQTVSNTRPSTNSSITGTVNSGSAEIWLSWQGTPQGT